MRDMLHYYITDSNFPLHVSVRLSFFFSRHINVNDSSAASVADLALRFELVNLIWFILHFVSSNQIYLNLFGNCLNVEVLHNSQYRQFQLCRVRVKKENCKCLIWLFQLRFQEPSLLLNDWIFINKNFHSHSNVPKKTRRVGEGFPNLMLCAVHFSQ